MKTALLPKSFYCLFLFGLVCTTVVQAQQKSIKTSHEDSPKKGHALYKKSKLYDNQSGPTNKKKRIADNALKRLEYEKSILRNPYTRKIPKGIRELEAEFSAKIEARNVVSEAAQKSSKTSGKSGFRGWTNRGPGNIGGRTRALAIDRNDEKTIFAGGVSGGLWRSTDQGQNWEKITNRRSSPSITAIVQDPRENRGHIWYYASGERFGNSASAGGAFYTGDGLFKSTNNGLTWRPMRNANDNRLDTITSFDIINSLAVLPRNGDLYAATFNGLFRLKWGLGDDIKEVLPSGFDSQTEVMITPRGKVYATVDIFGAENAGFYVSHDGDEFINISPEGLVPSYGRTVMAYDPSDENRVYFFSHNEADFSEAFLWRYQADAETPEEQWVDLSDNLPDNIGGPVGNLNLQGGYNMIIKVHPDNPDLILLGGTNLYRSTTGFTTPTGPETWIGGYDTANDISIYPNQHPDQHNLIFLPSDPNRVIASHDGGVSLTDDITDPERVDWMSLNNLYLTTQPYAVSYDPSGNSNDVMAGFQDNSTWYTDSEDIDQPWVDQFGGDGSFNAIADGGRTRYVSAQGGVVYRLNINEAGEEVSFTRVQPAGASGFRFIAPFVLDPVNDNIMYMPAGNTMWRNNDLDGIPLFSNAPTPVNWSKLTQTATDDDSDITAMDVSKFPVANRLYYGTSSGRIFRMDNANIDDQEPIEISAGKGLPPGNVNHIYVDPKNPDRVFVVFSNYGIPSIVVTWNGGKNWNNVSGNLEENVDGSGNGPSVRWFAMNGNNDGYFAGTSTGLYFTDRLQGRNTYWYREPQIGNGVVTQVRTRSDGFAVAGVHGNGVYSADFAVRPRPEPRLSVAYLLPDISVPINSEPFEVDISDLFVSKKKNANISIEFSNSNPDLVTAVLDGDKIKISIAPEMDGSAALGLVATSGREQVSEGFTVKVFEPPIYDQFGPATSSAPSQQFPDFGGILAQSADDFIVPEGSSWKVNSIVAYGVANNGPEFTDVTVEIYTDVDGLPGELVYNSGAIEPSSEPENTVLELELPEVVELESGSYWLSVYTNLAFGPEGQQWFWSTQDEVVGNESAFKDTGVFLEIDWIAKSLVFGGEPNDMVFQIFGAVETQIDEGETSKSVLVLDEALETEALAEIEARGITTVWPNPSSSEFYFSLKDNLDAKVDAKVYNILGQLVYEKDQIDATQTFSWNANGSPAGLYIVKITGAHTSKSFNIVKK